MASSILTLRSRFACFELDGKRELRFGQLASGHGEHLRRGVDADEARLASGGQQRRDAQECFAGRAAEVVDGAVPGEVDGELCHHALDLVVERNRALEHVVEDRRGLGAEVEVGSRTVGREQTIGLAHGFTHFVIR